MNTWTAFKILGAIDRKNVGRDSLLVWVPCLPLVMALIIRVGVPHMALMLKQRLAFDLTLYYPLIMSGFVLTIPPTVGMVIGFLLLDERDDRTLAALLVTPLPLDRYLAYRITAPMIVGMAMTLATYPLAGLVPLGWRDLLAVAALGSFTAPLVALFLAAFAENKVAGLALTKLVNAALMVPLVAFFIDSRWQVLAGVIPPYWPMKMFWLAAAGEPYWPFFAVGLIINLLALVVLVHRFKIVVHR